MRAQGHDCVCALLAARAAGTAAKTEAPSACKWTTRASTAIRWTRQWHVRASRIPSARRRWTATVSLHTFEEQVRVFSVEKFHCAHGKVENDVVLPLLAHGRLGRAWRWHFLIRGLTGVSKPNEQTIRGARARWSSGLYTAPTAAAV